MNKERRKRLDGLVSRVEELKTEFESIKDEEQEAYDNLPPGIQEGDSGEKMQTALSALEDIDTSLQEVLDKIKEAKEA
jgi:hypothetical protein